MKIFISINYKGWSSYKFSNALGLIWQWKRYYRKGHLWTPFIILSVKKQK
jgi:hypothetical protein